MMSPNVGQEERAGAFDLRALNSFDI